MPPFKAPKKNPTSTDKPIIEEQKPPTAYQVVYSRDVRKKQKKMFDGILVIENQKMKLMDSEAKQIYIGNDQVYENITQYYAGPFFIEIMNEIKYEDFKSGRVFLQQQEIIQQVVQKPKKPFQSKKLHDSKEKVKIIDGFTIDNFLYKQLRPHQIEGVKFMLECVTGRKHKQIHGCILADSMGLGKTLQAITLIWVLISAHEINKIVITCPVSLIGNWEKEIKKWLGPIRLQPLVAIGSKDEVNKQVQYLLHSPYNLLLTSYETFRNICGEVDKIVDLLICDEGHRLKNGNIKTVQTMNSLKCKRRIVLSGTPIQNNMKEFYACCDFVNPGIFNSYKTFKQVFQDPIEHAMEKSSNAESKELGKLRSQELSEITSRFILRRKPEILSKFLPSKFEYLLFCAMTNPQEQLYKKCLHLCPNSIMMQLNLLRKLTTHPRLIEDDESEAAQKLKVVDQQSIKFNCIKIIVEQCRENNEKIVINSYYGQTLDLVEESLIHWNVKFLRLDGKVPQNKRQQLVDEFNKDDSIIVFLLNGKSGGTGLNLVGANKMICVEVDWNPANDAQVMARIWRDGQKKLVHIYRLISCGTYEEKIMQRQLTKENLSQNIVDDKSIENEFSIEELKDLLSFSNCQKCSIFDTSDTLTEENDYPEELQSYIRLVKVTKTQSSVPNEFANKDAFLFVKEPSDEQQEPPLQQPILQEDNPEPITENVEQINDPIDPCVLPFANISPCDLSFLD